MRRRAVFRESRGLVETFAFASLVLLGTTWTHPAFARTHAALDVQRSEDGTGRFHRAQPSPSGSNPMKHASTPTKSELGLRPQLNPEAARSVLVSPTQQNLVSTQARLDARAQELDLYELSTHEYRYRGAGNEQFDATIAKDGTVTFHIDRRLQFRHNSVCAVSICLQRLEPKPQKQAKRAKTALDVAGHIASRTLLILLGGDYTQTPVGASPMTGNWGQPLHHHQLTPFVPASMVAAQGRYGYLPDANAEMQAFLERTFEFRLELAQMESSARIRRASQHFAERIVQSIENPELHAAEKRAAILDLWNEYSFSSVDLTLTTAMESKLDQERFRAATDARALILRFVQRHFPAQSPDAFTAAELAAFNANRPPKLAFWPYEKPAILQSQGPRAELKNGTSQ